MDFSTSNEMWTRLTQQYEQNATECVFELIDRYYQYAYTENDSVMAHLSKIEAMVGQLKDLGSVIDDNQLVAKVLMTLPAKFDHFRESWGVLPTAEKTKANLVSKLLLAESMIEHRTKTESIRNQERSANMIANSSYTRHSQMSCSICGLNNHTSNNCRRKFKRGNFSASQPSKRVRMECTYCNYQNHIIEDCRLRKKHEQSRDKSNNQDTKCENNSSTVHLATNKYEEGKQFAIEHAFGAFRIGQPQQGDFFADSASTQHMTEHHLYFSSFTHVTQSWNVKGVGSKLQ